MPELPEVDPIEHLLAPEVYVLASQERVYGARNIAGGRSDKSYETYKSYMTSPESAANCIICLIYQATYLLDKQLASLEKAFIEDGGYSESLFKRRLERRSKYVK